MGIQGLLPFLKEAHKHVNIKQFKGCTVAIDSYCWLHKGAFACAEKLAMGEKTDQYVFYCMKYINNLLSFGIKPILVFDGCHLPSKKMVEKSRRERRDMNRKKAAQFLREGKRAEARECLARCVDVTAKMALELMKVARAAGVDCIVAPYEADAQLAYLNMCGIAQVIITEDSDLLLFGCERIMFKMDINGNGVLIEKNDLNKAVKLRDDFYTFEKFRYLCILSGCDYLPSISGIGLVKAAKVFKLTKQTDMKQVIKKMPTTLKMKSLTVPPDYVEGFHHADNTFLYQLVYDPLQRKLIPLNPYPDHIQPEELHYAGPWLSQERAYQIAIGNIDINTGQRLADFDPDTFQFPQKSQSWGEKSSSKNKPHLLSIWDRAYRPRPNVNFSWDNPKQVERHSTKGKEVKIPSLNRKVPVKRPREEEEAETELNDEMLHSYSSSDGNATKRCKVEVAEKDFDDEDDADLLASCAESVLAESYLSSNSSPDSGARNALEHKEAIKDGPKVSTGLEKENKEATPKKKRNVFALRSSPRKAKFNINAAKTEVKSRFFASKSPKPIKKTSVFNHMPEDFPIKVEDDHLSEPEENTCENSPSGSLNITPNQSMEDHEHDSVKSESSSIGKVLGNSQNSGRQSPSVFSWNDKLNSFKYGKNSSKNKLSGNKNSIKLAANNPFKPVLSKSDGDQSKLSSINKESQITTELSSSQLSVTSVSDSEMNSQRSLNCSIDSWQPPPDGSQSQSQEGATSTDLSESFSGVSQPLPQSPFSNSSLVPKSKSTSSLSQKIKKEKSTKFDFYKLSKSQNNTTGAKCDVGVLDGNSSQASSSCDTIDLTSQAPDTNTSLTEKATRGNSPGIRSPPVSTSKLNSGSSKGRLGGCRASGLSKAGGGRGKALHGKANSGDKQASIKSFFSKFAHSKGKGSSNQIESKKTSDEEATPSDHTLMAKTDGSKTHVQRVLQWTN